VSVAGERSRPRVGAAVPGSPPSPSERERRLSVLLRSSRLFLALQPSNHERRNSCRVQLGDAALKGRPTYVSAIRARRLPGVPYSPRRAGCGLRPNPRTRGRNREAGAPVLPGDGLWSAIAPRLLMVAPSACPQTEQLDIESRRQHRSDSPKPTGCVDDQRIDECGNGRSAEGLDPHWCPTMSANP